MLVSHLPMVILAEHVTIAFQGIWPEYSIQQ